jgi:hypothetical protein
MDHFEKFSKEIDNIAALHPLSWIVRWACRREYWRRRYWTNRPLPFRWVDEEGVIVGDTIEVTHLTFHDMMVHQARGVLTEAVLLKGLRANAFQKLCFAPLGKHVGITVIQPRWV